MRPFEWVEATTLHETLGTPGKPGPGSGAVFKAGGIDLLDLMKEGIAAPKRVVNIRNIQDRELHEILNIGKVEKTRRGDERIGALVTLAEIAAHPGIRKEYPALADAAGQAATPQIRNVATLGGNLLQRPRCWYFRSEEYDCRKKGGKQCFAQEGENRYHAVFGNETCAIVHPSALAVPLVAYGAKLHLWGSDRHELLLEELFVTPEKDVTRESALAPGELISSVQLPPALQSDRRSAYVKQGEKESFDWPIADCAVVLEMEDGKAKRASVVLGAAAPVPWRAKAAEAALLGKAPDEAAARAAAKAALEGARPLAQNGYKLAIFEALARRAILAAAAAPAAK